MNAAIIAAAGQGNRFGAKKPKQFVEICGKPLVVHTLEKFEICPAVDEIILVLPEKDIANFQELAGKFDLKKLKKIVAGGKTRAESVFSGLNAIESEKIKIVAIHDGARPLVSVEEISKTIEKAEETGAACLVGKVSDTIKKISGENIVRTIDRSNLRRALTPQAFHYEILKRAFAASDLSEAATDECYLAEKLGVKITFIEGSAKNIKITAPEDLILAEMFLKNE